MVFLATVARILGLFLVSVSIAPVSTAYKCKAISFQLDRPKNRLIAANPKDDVPVSYTLIKGRPGRAAGQPAVFLLNGFNVGSEWYSQLCEKLCGKGLTIVTVQDKRTLSIVIPGLSRPGCDGNYTFISGGYLSILYEANATNLTMTPNAREAVGYFQKAARKNGVMFLAHSQGGAFGADIMNSTCDMLPGRGTARCDGYAPMVDSNGDDLIKAAVMYEGYSSGIYGIQLKPNRVIAYAAGQFNNATEQAYVNTTGCKIFARLKHANHYGLTNYVPGINGSQITPCARQAISDPASYQVTKSIQKQNVALFSEMALAVARAFKGGELHRAKLDVKSLQTKVTDLRQSCN